MPERDEIKISVVVPVFNSEKYICAAIESIALQTVRPYEIILVDDGGADSSLEIATLLLSESDCDWRVVSKKDDAGRVLNRGLASARNLGIESATGDWVLCIDSDDYIHRKTVELFEEVLKAYPDADFVFCDYENVSDGEIIQDEEIDGIDATFFSNEELLRRFYSREMPIIVPSMLLRTKLYTEDQIRFPDGCRFSEDSYFVYKLLLRTVGGVFLNQKLYRYVQHSGSIMSSSNIEKIITGFNAFVELQEEIDNGLFMTEFDQTTIFPREIIGELHTASKVMTKKDFKRLRYMMGLPENKLEALKNDGDTRVRIARLMLLYTPSLFFYMTRVL